MMSPRNVETLLRSHAEGLDEAMIPVTFEEVSRRAETRSRPLPQVRVRRFYPAGAWAAAAAAVLVVALVGLVAVIVILFSDDAPPVIDTPTTVLSENPTPTSTPVPTTIPPAATSTTTAATASAIELSWERLEPFGREVFPNSPFQFQAVVAGPDEYVAAVNRDFEYSIAISADGRDWSLIDPSAVPGDVDGLAYGSSGYVAVGSYGTPGVWVSPDAQTWTTPFNPGSLFEHQPRDVVWGNAGYVIAVDQDTTRELPLLFHSVDGSSWAPVAIPHADWMLDDASFIFAQSHLAYGDHGYVLAASDPACGGGAIWHSPDGLTWTLLPYREDLFGPIGGGCTEDFQGVFSFHDATYGEGGYVVVGMHDYPGTTTAGVLISPDGVNWTKTLLDPGDGWQWMNGIAAGVGGFVAAGEVANGQPIIWTSPDGYDWTPVVDEHLFSFTATAANPLGGDDLVGVSRGDAWVVAAMGNTYIVTGKMDISAFSNPDDPTNDNPVLGPTASAVWRATFSH